MVNDRVWEIYREVAERALANGQSEIADKMNRAAYEQACELSLGDAELGRSQANLLAVYKKHNNSAKIEAFWKSILRDYSRVFGKDHPRLILPVEELADIYIAQHKFKEAELYLKKSIGLNELYLRQRPRELAAKLKAVADFYQFWGRQPQAITLLKRASRLESMASKESDRSSNCCTDFHAGS